MIRAARAEDVPFLWEMLYEAIHVEPGESKPPRDSLASGPLAHYVAHWGGPGDRGIGTRLLHRLIDQAREDGYSAISLSVDPRNAALRLYERTGFQYVGANAGSWTMVKHLK